MQTQLNFPYHPPPPERRRVRDLPGADRPLERLQRCGYKALSTGELLALVLGSADAHGITDELFRRFDSLHQLARASHEQLMGIRGIGAAQAGRLLAMLELSRRLQETPQDEQLRVASPADAAHILMPRMAHLEQEELWVIVLNTRNRVTRIAEIYKGSLNASMVRIAELFRPAIEGAAAAILVAHNHPSGDPSPSADDIRVTRQIVKAGEMLDISVLDHVIIGNGRYVSLKERKLGFSDS